MVCREKRQKENTEGSLRELEEKVRSLRTVVGENRAGLTQVS